MLARTILIAAFACGCGRYGFDDAGGDGAVTENCDDIPGVLVCSSFEEDFGQWVAESQGNGSTSSICPNPRTGQGCFVASTSSGGSAARGWRSFEPIGEGEMIYARVHAFIASDASIQGINLAALDAQDSGIYGPDLNVVEGGQFEIYLEEGGPGAQVGPIPRDEWFCMHLAMFVHNEDGTIVAGYEDVSIGQNGIDTFPDGPYDYVAVGLDWTSDEQDAIEVAIDDVVVATSPVPCAR